MFQNMHTKLRFLEAHLGRKPTKCTYKQSCFINKQSQQNLIQDNYLSLEDFYKPNFMSENINMKVEAIEEKLKQH